MTKEDHIAALKETASKTREINACLLKSQRAMYKLDKKLDDAILLGNTYLIAPLKNQIAKLSAQMDSEMDQMKALIEQAAEYTKML